MAKPSGFSSGFGPGFGVGRYYYGLQQFIWDTSEGEGFWRLPSSVVGAVDLRPVPAQAIAGGIPQGFAFVASMQPIDVLISRSLHFGDENATGAMQDAWQSELGYRPQGAKVLDLLWDMLTAGADPTGDAACKPLIPGVDGFFSLFVGGHSLVKQERFQASSPAGMKSLDLLRREYRQLRQQSRDGRHRDTRGRVSPQHYLKVLDFWQQKYGLPHTAFIPGDLPDEGAMPHETTITDNFNRADNADLSVSAPFSWTDVTGSLQLAGNKIFHSSTNSRSRAESDLSSSDHYGQVDVVTAASSTRGTLAIARFASGAHTCYQSRILGDGTLQIGKVVAGVLTLLGVGTTQSLSLPDTIKMQCSGSTLDAYFNGASVESITDSSISGNTRCGIGLFGNTTAPNTSCDNFEAADLAAGGISADVPAGLIDIFGVAPATNKSAAIPVGLLKFTGVTPGTRKSLAVPIGLLDLLGTSVATAKAAAVDFGLIQFTGIPPLEPQRVDVPLGVLAFAGVAPATSKQATPTAAGIGLLGVTPQHTKSISIPLGQICFTRAANGPYEATGTFEDTGSAGNAWTNPSRAVTTNGSPATVTPPSKTLWFLNFSEDFGALGFGPREKILGVCIEVLLKVDAGTVQIDSTQLIKTDSPAGNAVVHSDNTHSPQTSYYWHRGKTYDVAADYGTTLNGFDLDNGFGIAVAFSGTGVGTLSVDNLRIHLFKEIKTKHDVFVPSGLLDLTGSSPTTTHKAAVSAAAVLFTGNTPTASHAADLEVGAIAFTCLAPSSLKSAPVDVGVMAFVGLPIVASGAALDLYASASVISVSLYSPQTCAESSIKTPSGIPLTAAVDGYAL